MKIVKIIHLLLLCLAMAACDQRPRVFVVDRQDFKQAVGEPVHVKESLYSQAELSGYVIRLGYNSPTGLVILVNQPVVTATNSILLHAISTNAPAPAATQPGEASHGYTNPPAIKPEAP